MPVRLLKPNLMMIACSRISPTLGTEPLINVLGMVPERRLLEKSTLRAELVLISPNMTSGSPPVSLFPEAWKSNSSSSVTLCKR